MYPNLTLYATDSATAIYTANGESLLTIPAGNKGTYRLAQLDDYHNLLRRKFCWQAPLSLSLQVRCSTNDHAGTWGFGLWNDPFTASLGLGGMSRRLPALPNCAWFFYASHTNYLSIHDHVPAEGFLAATFKSPLIPSALLTPGLLLSPILFLPPAARLIRKILQPIIKQDASLLDLDVNDWHEYRLLWHKTSVIFLVDGQEVFKTLISPRGHLGLVLWIDNQYAAFPPSGKLRFGTLENPEPVSLQMKGLSVKKLD